MNRNERLLAIGVGFLACALVLWYVSSSVMGRFSAREEQIAKLQSDLRKKNVEVRETQKAAERLAAYETRSLPADPDLAKSLYAAWLSEVIANTGLSEVNVTAARTVPHKSIYHRHSASIKAQGNLAQMVEFLYRFHEQDWLHRLDRISLKPVPKSKLLQLDMTISALSVATAPKADKLTPQPNAAMTGVSLADYQQPILERNIFGAPNSPPRLDVPTRSTATVGRTFEMTVKASDPDPLDKVQFELVKNADPPARLDPQSGRFTWSPRKTGEFTFEIAAHDDGLPPRSKSQMIYVTVKDPPPPEPPRVVEAPKPMFDLAKYTVLTAVLSINDEAQVWLLVQPTGETRRLQVGDQFTIGSVKGEVLEIGLDDVILKVDGKTRRLVKGGTLSDAT
jgi:Tfp pilus assembly protein PilO